MARYILAFQSAPEQMLTRGNDLRISLTNFGKEASRALRYVLVIQLAISELSSG